MRRWRTNLISGSGKPHPSIMKKVIRDNAGTDLGWIVHGIRMHPWGQTCRATAGGTLLPWLFHDSGKEHEGVTIPAVMRNEECKCRLGRLVRMPSPWARVEARGCKYAAQQHEKHCQMWKYPFTWFLKGTWCNLKIVTQSCPTCWLMVARKYFVSWMVSWCELGLINQLWSLNNIGSWLPL